MATPLPQVRARTSERHIGLSLRALCLVVFALSFGPVRANNLVIENFVLTGFNEAENYVFVQFDLRWENSWRLDVSPYNYDAAWVFVKYHHEGAWYHATLSLDGHHAGTCTAAAVIETADDGTGTFIYRSSAGLGDMICTSVQLRWNYGDDGVTASAEDLDVMVFGVEMVFIPEAAFHLGSGGTESGHFHSYPDPASTYIVTSEAAIDVSQTDGYLYYDHSGDQAGPIPAAFPKGYAPFYLMKYELTQQQYVDFLNTQPAADADIRAYADMGLITDGGDPPVYSAPVPDRPVGYIRHDYALAYVDWAALRWPTETEWEKAARGTRRPVPNEFAWGGTGLSGVTYELANEGTPDEVITNPGQIIGNATWATAPGIGNNVPGRRPARAGIFAASFPNATHPGPPSRPEAGASFYGVMEMSGNLWEWVVTVGSPGGRAFAGQHGTGSFAGDPNWYYFSTPITGGRRGGCFDYGVRYITVSNRLHGFSGPARYACDGLRAARTAP